MKKLLAIALTILMLASLFVLVSCGNKDDEGGDKNTSVSKSEWENALDLSQYKSFTFKTKEEEAEGDEKYCIESITSYDDGNIRVSVEEDGETETETDFRIVNSLDDLWDGNHWLGEIYSELDYENDLGYSLFTYSSSKGAYEAELEVDGIICYTEFYFEDGMLIKISASASESGSGYSFTGTYEFSNLKK